MDDPAQARVLLDREQVRFLAPFVGRESSALAASRALDVTLDRLLGRLRRLVALGLVQVTRVEPRKGRSIKYYRTVADEFFVPLSLLPVDATLFRDDTYWYERFIGQITRAMIAEMHRQPEGGARVHRAATGQVQVEFAAAPETPWRQSERDPVALAAIWHLCDCLAATPTNCGNDSIHSLPNSPTGAGPLSPNTWSVFT